MRRLWSVIAAGIVACTTSASAQEQSVSRVASGGPNTDIRVGVYVNVRPDCTSGPLPSIQLTSPPEKWQGHRQEGKGDGYQLQAVLGARGTRVHCVLSLACGFCGRRCSDAGGEVSQWQDASAAN
jgi:hypothetical protein